MKSKIYFKIDSFIRILKNSTIALKAAMLGMLFFMTGTSSIAQDCGTLNCTSNDVQITGAFLRDINGLPLGQCTAGDPVIAYLYLQLSTNAPRVGVSISGKVKRKVGDELFDIVGGTVGQCFGIALTGNNIIVSFSAPITWTCATNIVLTDVLISWGTGNSNFCNTPYTSGTPEPAKCPGTKSKCWRQPPAEYITVVVNPCASPDITAQPASQQKCFGSTAATFTVVYTEGAPDATIQWQGLSTVNGSTWTDLANNGTYTGVTTATLTVSNYTTSMSGYKYRAVLSNSRDGFDCQATTNGLATLTVYAIPPAPVVEVENNCDGTSTLSTTATGALLWSTGSTDASITVGAGTYTVTQTVNGCTSTPGSGTANPRSTPAAPVVDVENNCNGTSTLSTEATGALLWSTGSTDASITVGAGTYTVTQTVNGCTSAPGSGTANPGNTPAAAMVTYHAPACDATTFSVEVTNVASGVTYAITDKNGNAIPGVSPGNSVVAANSNNITFSNIPAGSGYKVTATAGFCSSAQTECGTADPAPNRVVTQSSAKEVTIELSGNQPTVVAFPNPFQTTVNFKLVSPVTGRVSLDIYNASGIRIGNAFNGVLQANVPVNTEFRLARPESGMLFYRMLGNGTSVSGKIMSVRQ